MKKIFLASIGVLTITLVTLLTGWTSAQQLGDYVSSYNQGVQYANRGLLQEAEQSFKEALQENPSFGSAQYNLAVIYERQGRIDEALEAYKRARLSQPLNPEIALALGNIYAREEQWESAINEYQQAVQINPNLPLAHEGLGKVYCAIDKPNLARQAHAILLRLDSEAANRLLLTISAKFPPIVSSTSTRPNKPVPVQLPSLNPQASSASSNSEASMKDKSAQPLIVKKPSKRDIDWAEIDKLLQSHPVKMMYGLPSEYSKRKAFLEGASEVQKMFANYPDIAWEFENSDFSKAKGNSPGPLVLGQSLCSLSLRPISCQAALTGRMNLFSYGWFNRTAELYNALPLHSKAYWAIRAVYSDAVRFSDYDNRSDKQEILFKRFQQLKLSDKTAKAFSSFSLESLLLPDEIVTRKRLAEKNLEELKIAASLFPKEETVHYALGNEYVKNRQYASAIAEFQKCIELAPSKARAYNALGMEYYRTKKYDLAEKNFQKAVDLNPENPVYHENLTKLYKRIHGE